MRRIPLVLAALLCAGTASADLSVSQRAPDMSGYATRSDIDAIQATIPKPASAVPPAEMIGGSAGTPGTYRPADARAPRITRSKTVQLAADGTATFDWSEQGALATPVQVVLTPVYTGAAVPKCWATAVTATSASLKCVIESVSVVQIIGLGINIGSVANTAPAGLQVGVIALPTS